ncbi:coiled-coil domain-containing protein 40 isoform X2 [Eleutherodactylus coqui]|uniref:coiled-coil domain-containing protein 40 isoform X2 n=1 Tax=Eleutherodactylus coqui TaxID=57060 RepID=UPI003462E577
MSGSPSPRSEAEYAFDTEMDTQATDRETQRDNIADEKGADVQTAAVPSSVSLAPISSADSISRSALSHDMESFAVSASAIHQLSNQMANSDYEEDEPNNREEEPLKEQNEDDEEELVVLDPNHPLMTRFQTALKNYLTKQIESLEVELRGMTALMKKNKSEREDLGVILYGIQQELARQQMGLEKQHDKYADISTLRRQEEEELESIRNMYKITHLTTNTEHKKISSLQTEVENLALRLFYMENMSGDVHSDISVMKRAVQKTEAERIQAEVEKQKQDMFVDRLTRELDRLTEQIALYESQTNAQREDTKAAREAVAEANMEIEAIGLEKKQLLQQWNSSLIGMTRRDEAYAALQEALILAWQELRSMETEIEGYKKSVTKEEEIHEKLAFMINRAESDAAMSKKLIYQCQAKQEALRIEFSTYMRTLEETEQVLSRVTAERAGRWTELNSLRKQIEKESQVKGSLETQIMEKLQEKLTSDKAAKYSSLLTEKLHRRKLELEIDYAKMENETAQVQLELNHSSSRILALQRTLAEMDQKIETTNELISHSQSEIAKRTIAIERKQASINLYSKQIETILTEFGGKELGPMEILITTLTKEIDECNSEIASVQQYWLRLQTEMVRLTKQREEQAASVELLKKELTILQQRKVRTENEIEQDKNEQKDIEHHMKNLKNDMLRLNMLLSKKSSSKEQLLQYNQLMESDFMGSLREAEKESIEMQENLENVQEEKERLLHSLVETEHHIMLWEKKIQLAKEMRNAVDSEVAQGEIKAMKAEIHRMQIRYAQLMKQQEKMIRDMEAVVSRRETITIRGKNQAEKDNKHLTARDFQGKMQELRKKIEEILMNTDECSKTISDLEDTQKTLSTAISDKQHHISSMKLDAISKENEIEQLQEKKRQNLSQIVAFQTRVKHLQAVKEGKYIPVFSSLQTLEAERQKQETHLHTVSTIIHQIQQEYPQYQSLLHHISLALEAKLGAQEGASERAP